MNWRLLPYSVGDPAWNMAVDEAIFTAYLQGSAPPTLRFYGWEPATLSIGYFQDCQRQVDLVNLRSRGYGLVRRNTGGRAVLHDRELTYAVVGGPGAGLPEGLTGSYLQISRGFVVACARFGIAAELHQTSMTRDSGAGACFDSPSWYELTVAGRKLIGSAQFRYRDSLLQHGSILLDFSAADLALVLNSGATPKAQFAAELEQRVTSFKKLGKNVAPVELAAAIVSGFHQLYQWDFDQGSLSDYETELVRDLITTKYATADWNLCRGKTNQSGREPLLRGV